MARYVMANRRAGKFTDTAKRMSRSAMASTMAAFSTGAIVVSDTEPEDPTARRSAVFEADPEEVAAITSTMSDDVMVEPEILHFNESVVPMDFLQGSRDTLAVSMAGATGGSLTVTVKGNKRSLRGAEVILFLRGFGGSSRRLQDVTRTNGTVTFQFSTFFQPSAIIAVPAGNFWGMVARGPSGSITIDCPALPQNGPLEWWHKISGVSRHVKSRGKGIRVGVVDSGTGPHPCLDHVSDIGAFINGVHDPSGGADSGSHGSHVNGIIGARPTKAGQYAGVAPGCNQFSARVFPANGGANQLDIANAIDSLSRDHKVDLINMSLGAETGSLIEQDAIQDALERGTLCVCAAANSSGPVEFPAAFPETVAISALGLEGWGPPGSISSTRLPQDPSKFGNENLYLANFSCFGPEITAGTGGVGILSTVPERFGLKAPYASMGGTSMASPLACGTLAALLSKSTVYKALPRNDTRSAMARKILRDNCRDIGLDRRFQGHGVPDV